jgi:hypothetical protein
VVKLPSWPFELTPPPELVGAWYVLSQVPTERVPWWAAHWLAGGHDGPALRELAGLGANDGYRVRDLLPDALADVGVVLPDATAAAASIWFDHVAQLCLAGRADERWVAQVVEDIVRASDYDAVVCDLPLGGLYGVEDAWVGGWGPDEDQLRAIVRSACSVQIRGTGE